MLVRLLVEVDMISVFFPIMDWQRKKTIFFDIKCHDRFLFNEVLTQ